MTDKVSIIELESQKSKEVTVEVPATPSVSASSPATVLAAAHAAKGAVTGILHAHTLSSSEKTLKSHLEKTAKVVYKNNPDGLNKFLKELRHEEVVKRLASLQQDLMKGRLQVEQASNSISRGAKAPAKTGTSGSAPSTPSTGGSSGSGPQPPSWPPTPHSSLNPGTLPQNPSDFPNMNDNWLSKIEGDPENTDTVIAYVEWLFNCMAKFPKSSIVTGAISQLGQLTGSTGTFSKLIDQLLIRSWYQEGGKASVDANLLKFKNYVASFNSSIPHNSFLAQLTSQTASDYANRDAITTQLANNPVSDDAFPYELSGLSINFFYGNSNLKKIKHKLFMENVDRIIKEFSKHPGVLVTLILATIGQSANEKQLQVGSYGDLQHQLDALNKQLAAIINLFSKAGEDPKTAGQGLSTSDYKTLFEDITKILYITGQEQLIFGSTVKGNMTNAFQGLLNAKFSYTYKGPDGKKVTEKVTMAELLGDPKKYGDVDWSQVKAGLDPQLYKQPGKDPTKDPGGPSELTQEAQQLMGTAQKAITGQSQSVSVRISTLTSQVQTIYSVLKSMLIQDWVGWESKIVQNSFNYGS